MTLSTEPLAQQLKHIQAKLATRASTLHFAHAAVAVLCALVIEGAAAKMYWDFTPWSALWAPWVTALGFLLLAYGFVRYGMGKRVLGHELLQYADLKRLQKALGLDDPSVLLPQ